MAINYKQMMYLTSSSELPASADDGQLAMLLDSKTTVVWNAAMTAWEPLSRNVVFKSTVSVNAMNTGSTLIYTLPPTPLYFYPTMITARKVVITGSGTLPALTIGSNSTSYDNIASNSLLSSTLGSLGVGGGQPQLSNYSPGLAGGTQIFAKVNTSALLYTAYTVKFDIEGHYDTVSP